MEGSGITLSCQATGSRLLYSRCSHIVGRHFSRRVAQVSNPTSTEGGTSGPRSASTPTPQDVTETSAARNRRTEKQRQGRSPSETAASVQIVRSWTGLLAVILGDAAIFAVALTAMLLIKKDTQASTAIVSVLTAAFTTIGTMTTAYFGIKASSNTAQDNINLRSHDDPKQSTDGSTGGAPETASGGDSPHEDDDASLLRRRRRRTRR